MLPPSQNVMLLKTRRTISQFASINFWHFRALQYLFLHNNIHIYIYIALHVLSMKLSKKKSFTNFEYSETKQEVLRRRQWLCRHNVSLETACENCGEGLFYWLNSRSILRLSFNIEANPLESVLILLYFQIHKTVNIWTKQYFCNIWILKT